MSPEDVARYNEWHNPRDAGYTVPWEDYLAIRNSSIHNANGENLTLEKYFADSSSLLGKSGIFLKTLGWSAGMNAKSLLTLPSRLLDNLSTKLDDLQRIISQSSDNLAYATAGKSSSLCKLSREADNLRPIQVQMNFQVLINLMILRGGRIAK